jgi:hypothetical protein
LAAPELHLAGAWNIGPPPLILSPKNNTGRVPTTELFLFSHRTPDTSCGHTVLLCRSHIHNITNYAYFDATYTESFASTYLPNSSWPTVLAPITQNCRDLIVEIIAITSFKPPNASLGVAFLNTIPVMPVAGKTLTIKPLRSREKSSSTPKQPTHCRPTYTLHFHNFPYLQQNYTSLQHNGHPDDRNRPHKTHPATRDPNPSRVGVQVPKNSPALTMAPATPNSCGTLAAHSPICLTNGIS